MKHVTIGRAPVNDFIIDMDFISSHHAILKQVHNGSIILVDLNSKNGTFVNGKRISQPKELKRGDIIYLGAKGTIVPWEKLILPEEETTRVLPPINGETVISSNTRRSYSIFEPSRKPLTVFQPTPHSPEFKIASRETRFWASIMDSVALYTPYIPLIVALEKARSEKDIDAVSIGAFMALLFVLLRQVMLLSVFGQTIGKKTLKIKIVKKSNGKNGGFSTNVIIRWFLFIVPNLILISVFQSSDLWVGVIIIAIAFIDAVFIFQNEHNQCLHDLVSGTVVVLEDVKKL